MLDEFRLAAIVTIWLVQCIFRRVRRNNAEPKTNNDHTGAEIELKINLGYRTVSAVGRHGRVKHLFREAFIFIAISRNIVIIIIIYRPTHLHLALDWCDLAIY